MTQTWKNLKDLAVLTCFVVLIFIIILVGAALGLIFAS